MALDGEDLRSLPLSMRKTNLDRPLARRVGLLAMVVRTLPQSSPLHGRIVLRLRTTLST